MEVSLTELEVEKGKGRGIPRLPVVTCVHSFLLAVLTLMVMFLNVSTAIGKDL